MSELARICIVGGSLAGLRAAQGLRAAGFDRTVVIVGEEPRAPYNRPPLSKQFLTGEIEEDGLTLPIPGELDLDWRLGERATALRMRERRVETDHGHVDDLEAVIIATGSVARRLDLPALEGIHTLRSLHDARELRASIHGGGPVAVIGAGLIGCEIASSCRQLGVPVTLIEPAGGLMLRALGASAGELMGQLHRQEGVDLRLSTSVKSINGSPRVQSLELSDGSRLTVDTVVVAVGARPATDWLSGSGLRIQDGVLCDEHHRALGTAGRVMAVGDVCRWRTADGETERGENWIAAAEQAGDAAQTLVHGVRGARPRPVPFFWTEQHHHRLQIVGRPGDADRAEITASKQAAWTMTLTREGEIVAAAALDMPGQLARARRQLAAQAKEDVMGAAA